MSSELHHFIELGKKIAENAELKWAIPLDESGCAADKRGWCLSEIVGAHRPFHYLKDFRADKKTFEAIRSIEANEGADHRPVLSGEWQELIKAITAYQLLRKRRTPSYIAQSIIRPMRVMATVAKSEDPSELRAEDARRAIAIAREIQPSGKLADLIAGLIHNYFDGWKLTYFAPIYPLLDLDRIDPQANRRKPKYLKTRTEMLPSLNARKSAEKLPQIDALWEVVRIVFTEEPRTFMDEIRFAVIRILITTGMRIGEVVRLPVDCLQELTHYDRHGRLASESGGISESTTLKYYAEKRQREESDSTVLYESSKDILPMFSVAIRETVDRLMFLTSPLRKTLRMQIASNRVLPWYDIGALIPVVDLYTHMTGNPTWTDLPTEEIESWTDKSRTEETLEKYQAHQKLMLRQGHTRLSGTAYMFLNRLKENATNSRFPIRFLTNEGKAYPPGRMQWSNVYVRIADVERYIRNTTKTKLSDTSTFKLEQGSINAADLLFLKPKRSLAEERNAGVCDLNRYHAVGYLDTSSITMALGGVKQTRESIFKRYGSTEEDFELDVESHQFRHLMNTEMFRQGLADTIITKHFGRQSTTESEEYNHQTLSDHITKTEISPEAEVKLGPTSSDVYRMITSGKVAGPIVDEFKAIQASEGDDAAFEFLAVEADGFHSTPYGFCLNSFTVDPCPKHLECFDNCRHLAATGLQEHTVSLEKMKKQLKAAKEAAESRPPGSIGRDNQIQHAETRIKGVEKLLKTKPGEHPFPDGRDLSKPENQ